MPIQLVLSPYVTFAREKSTFLRLPKTLDTKSAIALSITGFAGNVQRISHWNGRAIKIYDLSQSVLVQLRGLVWFQMMRKRHLRLELSQPTIAN